jgi:cellulose biosynthesis protein BcsQ
MLVYGRRSYKRPPFPDFDSRIGRRKPIILTVANNKGGVGKTTVVGNLLAYFDKKGKSVLAIDMDYQGSLSTMLQGEQDAALQTGTSNVNALLQRGADVTSLFTVARGLGKNLTRSSFVSAFYDLALFEDRMMVEWLLQENDGEDVRYRLANVLLQRQVERYDVVLIDVPPRLSAGTINALCASTHVLIPTKFNPIAAEPVANFLTATTRLLNQLNPAVRFAGVVETMSPPDNIDKRARGLGRSSIQSALGSHPGVTMLENSLPQSVAFGAGGIAYLADAKARAIFDKLGDEISQRIGL